MKNFLTFLSLFFLLSFKSGDEHKTLEIGAAAPDFNLKGVDGKMYNLAAFSKAKVLVIVFTCNHCPTAQAYEARLKKLTTDYADKSVQVVAISPNDPKSSSPEEWGYTEYGDTYDEMILRAKEKAFNFPYLYDGDTQETANKYGPSVTPQVFIFDKDRKLRFNGRIDDVEDPKSTPKNFDTRNAIDDILAGKPLRVEKTKTFGCSVKWVEKKELVNKAQMDQTKAPVTLDTIGETGLKTLLKNETGKLRLINLWATWCGPCVSELPDFVIINRMYSRRDFEFITISTDKLNKKDKALQTLSNLQVSAKNYIFNANDSYKLIELIDSSWQGALPYTLLVEPNGKIIYRTQGRIDAMEMKKRIVDHPLIGRVY